MKLEFKGKPYDVDYASLRSTVYQLCEEFREAQLDVPYGRRRDQLLADARTKRFSEHYEFLLVALAAFFEEKGK